MPSVPRATLGSPGGRRPRGLHPRSHARRGPPCWPGRRHGGGLVRGGPRTQYRGSRGRLPPRGKLGSNAYSGATR
eukprot:744771-Alexandrium_andersonii.AAC.1